MCLESLVEMFYRPRLSTEQRQNCPGRDYPVTADCVLCLLRGPKLPVLLAYQKEGNLRRSSLLLIYWELDTMELAAGSPDRDKLLLNLPLFRCFLHIIVQWE